MSGSLVRGLVAALLLGASLTLGTAAAAEPTETGAPVLVTLEAWIDGYFGRPARPTLPPDPDPSRVNGGQRLSASLDYGLTDWLALGLEGYVAATEPDTLQGAVSAPAGGSLRGRRADLTRGFLRAQGEGVDLLAGRAPLSVGLGDLYRPTDRFEPLNYANPLHPLRMGAWQLTGTVGLGGTDTLQLSVLPSDDRGAQPTADSRWRGTLGDANFFGFPEFAFLADRALLDRANLSISDRFRTRPLEDWGYLALLRREGRGGDAYLGAHLGPGAFPTLEARAAAAPTFDGKPSFSVVKVVPTAVSVLAGGSLVMDRTKLVLEGLYQNTLRDRDDDFLRLGASVSWRFDELSEALGLRGVGVTVQYLREVVTKPFPTAAPSFDPAPFRNLPPDFLVRLVNFSLAEPVGLRVGSREARPSRDTVAVELRTEIDAATLVTLRAAVNNADADAFATLRLEHALSDALTVQAALFLIAGDPASPFGRFARDDGAYLGLTRRF